MPGVYISYPFCTQKCSFCNFASQVGPAHIRARYAVALLNEIKAHRWSWIPETVYFGGGTPSLMPLDLMRQLTNAIPRRGLTEVTLECAPGTLTARNAAAWRHCGVNRVSLGVQSFVSLEICKTGRRHSGETVERDVELLRTAGIHNINIDLIAGLPGQTIDSWEESLDWIAHLDPPHVSVYIFEIDEDSRLGKEALLGGLRYSAGELPGDDITVQLYERAVERLAGLGIERYEISNFARAGYVSRHNLKYWQLEPYVGFGLDAHSYDGAHRWSNPDNLESYLASKPSRDREGAVLQPADPIEEHFFVGLRLMRGIEPTAEEWSRFAVPVDKWTRAGMLEREGNRLRLSDRGVLVSNEIFQEFIDV